MTVLPLLTLSSLLLCGFALPNSPSPALHRRRASPSTPIALKLTLAQSNLHNLDSFLLDISDPRSPNYGNHWSPQRVKDTFRPAAESVDTVHAWLTKDAGLDENRIRLGADGDVFHLDLTVGEAERLLETEYWEDGDGSLGCHDEGYKLPSHVAKHVDLLWPTTHLSSLNRITRRGGLGGSLPPLAGRDGVAIKPIENVASLAQSGCDESVTLDCLRALYNFDFTPVSADVNTVGVFAWGGNIYRTSDLDIFFAEYSPEQVGTFPTLISVEGGDPELGGKSSSEGDLDIELMMGLLGPHQNLSLYQVALNNASGDPTDRFLAALDESYCPTASSFDPNITDCGNKPRTNVVSISYHFNPDLNDPVISPIVQRQCAEFGKLALTGMTFIASSGDGGVGYGASGGCLVNGTINFPAQGNKGSFIGQLPASCPYVTAVGATSVSEGANTDQIEEATTDFPSGGGFSNNFLRPQWQADAVQNYLDKYAPDYAEDIFNRSGRAYPDVAANGYPIVVATKGRLVHTGGTSASTPIFASLIAAVNDARLAAGKSPVGFINPALYSPAFASAFNDVTKGSNPACETDGFPAAPGWDPVTGLGTPNFEKLKAAFLALP
ncbi:subtilisin-like protein [Favolaschia claudopus]|uniref:Subtilisin-like protein n=1 Tax=Favolaschia claudopus TaxID=2862362 RepID=A0AAW0D372_9AGAR